MPILKNTITALFVTSVLSITALADIDPALQAMLETAIKSGDKAQISAIEKVAIATWPEDAVAIKVMVEKLLAPVTQDSAPKQKLLAVDATKNETAVTNAADTEKTSAFNYYLNPALWNGQLELGGGTSTGNTEEQGISIGLSFKRMFAEKWEHDLDSNFDYAKSQGLITKRKIIGEYKLLWKPWKSFYTMNFLQLEADKFSGYKYRITENIGIGYEIINKTGMLWRIEGGPGIQYNKLDISDISESKILGRVSNTFEMDIWKNMKISNKTSVVYTNASTTFDNKAQLSARINAHLAAKISFGVKHDTGAPLGKEKTDTVSRATIVYDF